MALGPLRPCPTPYCSELVRGGGPCARHTRARQARKLTPNQKGYTYQWRKARAVFLEGRACAYPECGAKATVVDHIVPHNGDQRLFWDETNWQPLCARHHGYKTARHDGAFGNPRG